MAPEMLYTAIIVVMPKWTYLVGDIRRIWWWLEMDDGDRNNRLVGFVTMCFPRQWWRRVACHKHHIMARS